MEIKCENSGCSKRIPRTRQSRLTCAYREENRTTANANERSKFGGVTERYNTRSSVARRETSGLKSNDKSNTFDFGIQNYQEETGVIPRYNTRSLVNSNNRRSSGRVTRRYKTRRSKSRKQKRRKRLAANQTKSYSNESELIPELKVQAKLKDYASQTNIPEPPDGSNARRLLFPNAAQNIAALIPDQEVRVEFIVRQSDLPKLTEFLGEPVIQQIGHDQAMTNKLVSDMNESAELLKSRQMHVPSSTPTNRSNRAHSLRLQHGTPVEKTMEATNMGHIGLIDVNKVTVQKIKYYYNQLPLQEQRKFMEEIAAEGHQKDNLSIGGNRRRK